MKDTALLLPVRPAELHVRGGAIGFGGKKVANAVHVSSRTVRTRGEEPAVTTTGRLRFVSTACTRAFICALSDVVQGCLTAMGTEGVKLIGFVPSGRAAPGAYHSQASTTSAGAWLGCQPLMMPTSVQ